MKHWAGMLAVCLGISVAGASVDYDNVDDYLDCGSSSDIDTIAGLSLSLWHNLSSTGEGPAGSYLAAKNTATQWFFRGTTNESGAYQLWGFYSTALQVRSATASYSTGSWEHVLVVWPNSVTASATDIYVDGVLSTPHALDSNGTAPREDDSALELRLGNNANLDYTLDGELCCVAMWTAALTASDAQTLASGAPRAAMRVSAGTPLRYWPMVGHVEGAALSGAGTIIELTRQETCTPNNSPTGRSRSMPW